MADPWGNNLIETNINGNTYMTYKGLPSHIYDCLQKTAAAYPNKTALMEPDGTVVSFAELMRRAENFAGILYHRYRVRKGDVCAILCVNSIDFVTAFYATMRIGAIALPLSTKYKFTELAYPFRHSGAKVIILDVNWLDNVHPLIRENGVDTIFTGPESLLRESMSFKSAPPCPSTHKDGAMIVYTSGTTGCPKGAYITHFNFLHSIESYRLVLGLAEVDSTMISIPIFNITGLAALMGLFIYIGGTAYLQPYFNAREMVLTVEERDISFLHASPTVFIKMLEYKDACPALSSVTIAACGSANLPMSILRQLHDWMPHLSMHTVYGLTETTSPAAIMPGDPIAMGKPGSSGLPIPGVELRVWDEVRNCEAETGQPGTLWARGSTVIERYLYGAFQEAFSDSWFNTGDIARIDEDGFLYILDRKKDMINRGGEKIYCIEVENILSAHPSVAECAVVGVPHDVFGEEVWVVVCTNGNGVDAEELRQYMYGKLATFKLPSKYVFMDKLPKSENGKVSKLQLKEKLAKVQI